MTATKFGRFDITSFTVRPCTVKAKPFYNSRVGGKRRAYEPLRALEMIQAIFGLQDAVRTVVTDWFTARFLNTFIYCSGSILSLLYVLCTVAVVRTIFVCVNHCLGP